MAFCEKCGKENDEGDKFCCYCGTKLNEQTTDDSPNNDSIDDLIDKGINMAKKQTESAQSMFSNLNIFSKEKLIEKGIKMREDNFNNMRDDVSYLLPEAAKKLNVSLDDCYLTFKISKKQLLDTGRNKLHHADKIIVLMSIFDDKLSYVVLARLHQFSNTIKEISLEEEIYSLHFDKISGISYSKMGLDLTMVGGELITLRATDLFGNSITKELNDKYNNYNDNKKNISNDSNSQVINKADILIKYKELLDAGALTQEEFDMLKKEIINS